MEVHRSRPFKRWVDDLVTNAKTGDQSAVQMTKHVLDELNYIKASTGNQTMTPRP
jgi:hypothetical protein